MSFFQKRPYVAGISGGPDSMALLTMYHRYIKVVCIVNYHLREQAELEVELVKNTCEKYHIPCEIYDVYPPYQGNFQSVARQIRYDFFIQMAQKYHAKKILLAHHFDDWLETAFIQEQRHSKALIYGIKPDSDYKGWPIYRPFLFTFRKDDLTQFCDDKKIPFFIDASNQSDYYERNRVRKIIRNWDQKTVENFYKKITSRNKVMLKEQNHVNQLWENWSQSMFDIGIFNAIEIDLGEQLVYKFLRLNGENNCNHHKIQQIVHFIQKKSHGQYRLENKRILVIDNFHLVLKHDGEKNV